MFWIGFNLGLLPLSLAAKRWAAARVMGAAALVAALGGRRGDDRAELPLLIAAQLVAGAAWAGVIVAAFAWALARGGAGQAGAFAGALSSVLALATLLRMGSVSAGLAARRRASAMR